MKTPITRTARPTIVKIMFEIAVKNSADFTCWNEEAIKITRPIPVAMYPTVLFTIFY